MWEKRISQEERKRKAKAAQLKDLGYDFEMPVLKKVHEALPLTDNAEEGDEPDAIGSIPEVVEKTIIESVPEVVREPTIESSSRGC